jgi:hypothetical protein
MNVSEHYVCLGDSDYRSRPARGHALVSLPILEVYSNKPLDNAKPRCSTRQFDLAHTEAADPLTLQPALIMLTTQLLQMIVICKEYRQTRRRGLGV